MEEMTVDIFYQIMNAKEVICEHCENKNSDKCVSCQVTAIVDNAQIEAQMCGLFD
ncbi:MAG: hypothetical protein IJ807_00060 [Eubacterium sp.]|nr:hypothetical protein [Eubacterium sp.]